ncbi:UNVERIFIED_ORG: hypothetical protein E4P37_17610 [Bacillus sp. AZ43]
MTSPRDRDPDDGSEWREPSHLGGDDATAPDEPNFADRRRTPREEPSTGGADWQPPGWDLPAHTPERPAGVDPTWAPPPAPPAPERTGGGLFGSRRRQRDPEMERAFTYEGDPYGAQAWALQHGWTVSDGSSAEDAVLGGLIASAPVRPGKEARPAGVLRGRAGALELVAFDIAEPYGKRWVATHAITAAPLLGAVPPLRLSPARLWKHGIAGMVPVPTGNEAFDARWQLLAGEDGPQVQRLAQDPAVQGLLLGTDDGDEFWTSAGFVAAIRPDGHRPQLIEHHARLLTAIVGALAAGF